VFFFILCNDSGSAPPCADEFTVTVMSVNPEIEPARVNAVAPFASVLLVTT